MSKILRIVLCYGVLGGLISLVRDEARGADEAVSSFRIADEKVAAMGATRAALSDTGKFVALCGQDHGIYLFDAPSGRALHELRGHANDLTVLKFSPDSKFLVSSAQGDGESTRVWDLETGQEFCRWELPSLGVQFVSDREVVSIGPADVHTCLIDRTPSTTHITRVPNQTHPLGVFPDGKSAVIGQPNLATTFHAIFLFGLREQRIVQLPSLPFAPSQVAFPPDGRTVAVCGNRNADIAVYELERSGSYRLLQGHQHTVNSVDYSSDGRFIVSGDFDGEVRIWETLTWQTVDRFSAHAGQIRSIVLSRDGRWLVTTAVGGSRNDALLWSFHERLFAKNDRQTATGTTLSDEDWEMLANENPQQAFQALAAMRGSIGAMQSIRDRLRTVGQQVGDAQIAAWIELLDHKNYAVREDAFVKLMRYRAGFTEQIRAAIRVARSLETEVRLRQLLTEGVSESVMTTRDWWRLNRIIYYLELEQSDLAVQLLQNLAEHHPDQHVATLAKDSLDRIAVTID